MDKRFLRNLKRDVKKLGNKRRRSWLKRQLDEDPENAHYDEYDFGTLSSKHYNGMDRDRTRRREEYEEG
jgi:hypothetical protein